jgi:hypothetical protein
MAGVNTIITAPSVIPKIQEYWKNHTGKIQFISDLGPGPATLLEMIKRSIDAGAVACYMHGSIGDALVRERNFDLINKALELIRKNGLPAGIGAHLLETVQGCINEGIKPDFWMKTLRPLKWGKGDELYPQYDEINRKNPEETIQFMNDLKEPWIAFKTMTTGVIPPSEGFKFAFDGGADFVCAGMFDWQLIDDLNIGLSAIQGAKRKRPWRALTPDA